MTKFIKNWFSNFEPFDEPVEYEGIWYDTPEHMYQAMKTLDPEERRHVASARTPGISKRRGRSVKLREDWEVIKIQVMEDILRLKFTTESSAGRKLMSTTDNIVEWNNWGDRFWGVTVDNGMGQNHLGILLMKIRQELQENSN